MGETIVIIDFQGHPIRYDQLGVYDEVIAKERCIRLDLQVQTKESRGAWRHLAATELGEDSLHWRMGLSAGAKQLQQLAVKANDAHYDAKLFVCAHPYGTGSLHSEFGYTEHMSRSANFEKCWLFCVAAKNLRVYFCVNLSIVSPDWVPAPIKSWFDHELCRSKNCFGVRTCGVFSNCSKEDINRTNPHPTRCTR